MRIIFACLLLSLLVVASKAGDPEKIHGDLEDETKDPAEWTFDDEPREPTTPEMAMRMLIECLTEAGRVTKKCMRKFKRKVSDEMFKPAMDALHPCWPHPKDGQKFYGCLMKLKESIFDVEASGENWF